ncbi:MAG: sugar transferase [Candidatus Syntrophopropionicum ammoniitolerans]
MCNWINNFITYFVNNSYCHQTRIKSPVIFQQDRLGLNGQVFKIYKFRSMCVGAEKEGVYETKGDMRVTKVGRIIRKTSIDELPQFVNIIKGDMSIIGPRPTLTYHPWPLEEYTHEQRKRFNVRPGVTGWAQINGRKDVPWDKRIEYDMWYVDNLSFELDFKIFFKTVIKVLTMQDNINVGKTAVNNTALSTTKSETAATIIKD